MQLSFGDAFLGGLFQTIYSMNLDPSSHEASDPSFDAASFSFDSDSFFQYALLRLENPNLAFRPFTRLPDHVKRNFELGDLPDIVAATFGTANVLDKVFCLTRLHCVEYDLVGGTHHSDSHFTTYAKNPLNDAEHIFYDGMQNNGKAIVRSGDFRACQSPWLGFLSYYVKGNTRRTCFRGILNEGNSCFPVGLLRMYEVSSILA